MAGKQVSHETAELLASSEATMSQLAQLFETDAKTLPKRMKGVIPRGSRNGYKTYNIREAASRIIPPGYEIEEFIRQMGPGELNAYLLKDFWNGQRARQTFEREAGDLWPTGDVVEAVAVLGKEIRMTLLLTVDVLEREEGLTTGQKKVFKRIIDGAIKKLNENITERFREYHANRGSTGPAIRSTRGNSGRVPAAPDDEEVDI